MVLRFGISQVHGGATVLEGARDFTMALGRLLGTPTRLHVAENYDALQQSLLAGNVEMAWLPPFLHIEAARHGAHLAAICERAGALTYRSALIVRADGPIHGFDDLRAARVAWTDRSSASGYVFPRLLLVSSGVDPGQAFAEEQFLGSPREVCSAVSDGRADLGACFTSEAHAADPALTLADVARVYPAATWRLRVLAVTRSIPSDGVVLTARTDADARLRIVDALLRLSRDPQGASGIAKLFFAERLVAVSRSVSDAIDHMAPLLYAQGGRG